MSYFDDVNFLVSPVYDASVKAPNLKDKGNVSWKSKDYQCSWEEREDVFPGIKDWYVLPPSEATYYINGVEVGYYVIDVDNHAGDKFKEAVEFLKKCNLPRSLTVRTPSGGLHIYYWATLDSIPEQLPKANATGLPIEIKTKTGVMAPNGRDRVIIVDEPIAYLSVTQGTLFAEIAKLKPDKPLVVRRKPVNPDYEIPEPAKLNESQRHDTMLRQAMKLRDDGCPDEKIMEWLKKTRDVSPGLRRITDRELENMIDWEGKGIEYNYDDIDKMLEEAQKEESKPTFASIFPGATPLESWDAIYAKALFSTKDEIINMVMDELAETENEDECNAVVSLVESASMDELRFNWAHTPLPIQKKFVDLKEILKIALA